MSPPLSLAHVLPVEHGATGDATFTIALLTLGVLASAFLGARAGDAFLRRVRLSLLAALSAGMLVFLAYDLLKETASLGQGLLANPMLLLGILASFALGTMIIPTLGREEGDRWLAWAWLAAISLHSLGEGYTLGTEATTAALGSATGIASFLLHKGMEAFTIPILLGSTFGARRATFAAVTLAWITLMGALLGVLLGATTLPLLFFAAGAGSVVIALVRLARKTEPDTRHAVAVLLGVLVVYAAGLLHEF